MLPFLSKRNPSTSKKVEVSNSTCSFRSSFSFLSASKSSTERPDSWVPDVSEATVDLSSSSSFLRASISLVETSCPWVLFSSCSLVQENAARISTLAKNNYLIFARVSVCKDILYCQVQQTISRVHQTPRLHPILAP